ncbi:ATPase inhibitor, mitochondrial-like [Psammomys obesus]|uniref:ATPase inhibitor, mitochondrial-like n=1 Tax=Psammomys obesus TaxID=48139 RepID=UPI0024528795|nr:ATPase inhibitor, mitochondrial-like [Psammomys obesus]
MAGSAAARARLCAWGVRALRGRGFRSDVLESVESGAGSIREAGGAFGRREKAEEDRYVREMTKIQLAALRQHHEDEIVHHKREIERLKKQIERHQEKLARLTDNQK